MGLKPTTDELAAAMAQALASQQSEELALVKAQLAVANDKIAQHERSIAALKRQLREAERATQFVDAFMGLIEPMVRAQPEEVKA